MAFDFETIMRGITSELKTLAKTESVVGSPIEIEGKTIIPVIKVKLGFGAGGGEDTSNGKRPHPHGTGGGGGGGVSIEPAAFITVIGDQISVLSPKGAKFEKLAEVVPDIVTKIMEVKSKKQGIAPEGEGGEPPE